MSFLKHLLRGRKANAETHHHKGRAYAKQKRWNKAIREFRAALRINPDDTSAHYALGVAYRRQKRLHEAVAELQAALRIAPDMGGAHYSLGLVYHQQGRVDDAIHQMQLAAQLGYQQAQVLLDDWSSRFDGTTQETRSPRVWHDPNDVLAMASRFVIQGIQLAQAAQAADEEAAKSQAATVTEAQARAWADIDAL